MAASIFQPLVSDYAIDIYIYGSRTLANIPTDYYIPVEQYAATTFTADELQTALANGWITQQQYTETESYIPAQ
jgi:predicted RNA-binding protein associated with RNAse of E/G family